MSAARLSVVEQVYHQVRGGASTPVVTRYGVDLRTGDGLVSRTFPVSSKWERLPGDWPRTVSTLVVQVNVVAYDKMPTREQRTLDESRHVLLGFTREEGGRTQHSPPFSCVPAVVVGVGESCRFRPADVRTVWVRSDSPGTTVTVTAVPG